MNPNLQTLIELQKLDNFIRALKAEIHSLPRKISAIENQLTEHIQRVEIDKKKLADGQRARRKRESDISGLKEKISRHKDQMLEVKTNEQYRALQHEIEFHEKDIRKLEDEILAEMIESESLEKQLKENERNLATERANTQEEVRAAERIKQEDEAKLQVTEQRRLEAQKGLSADVYFGYQRILNARKGTAVAEVLNGACAACHVRLRPQAFNDVQLNQGILNCESCGCILYFVPPPPSAPAVQ